MPGERLLSEVAALALDLPGPCAASLAAALAALPADAPAARREQTALGVVPAGARGAVARLLAAWAAEEPDLAPASLADLLRAAEAADALHRQRQALELVWTGPNPAGATFRRTDQALLDLVEGAARELLVITYVAYRAPGVREALARALARGVRVDLLLESSETNAAELTDLLVGTGRCTVWEWPEERRPRDPSGKHGHLHAKAAVADRDVLLVSSANLTGYALALNMELGVLVRGGPLPGQVVRHFEGLVREGGVREVGSR